ncbi:threonine synthase [Candidatus Amarolinea dominans]|uniref:threonine synthase n=1 Tax=Candidatus Amarolinea dominans TaxID=3140696 RepID=UPI001DB435EF|nr:threonine synthase [Anaerolineae bacterium]
MNQLLGWRCTLCGATYAPHEIEYVCPQHGDAGIVDAVYDYAGIAAAASPRTLAASRDTSMWRYRALLPVAGDAPVPPLHVGGTPLYHAAALGAQLGLPNLVVKDDGRNPTASFKDRASALVLLKAQEQRAAIVTTASTGNAGAALAGLAASIGQPTVIFAPKTAPPAKVAQLLTYGATVLLVDGNYDAAFELCLAASKEFGWYCRNTGYNPYTVEGKKTAAYEICEQLRWQAPDAIFVSVGDGNIITGLHRGLQDLLALGWIDKLPRLMAVQASGSSAIYNAWASGADTITPVQATTVADSIAADLPRDGLRGLRAIRETGGKAIQVTDDEIPGRDPAVGSADRRLRGAGRSRGAGRAAGGDWRAGIGERRAEIGDWRAEIGDRRSGIGDRGSEIGDRRSEIGDRRPEIGDRRSEIGDRRSETGDRREWGEREIGERRAESGGDRGRDEGRWC